MKATWMPAQESSEKKNDGKKVQLMRLARIESFFLCSIFLGTPTNSTNCCDDLPLWLCIQIFFVLRLFAVYYALWVTFSTFYFIQSSTFFHIIFFSFASLALSGSLSRFGVNKCALCEYYIIHQTYSVIQFVHAEFHFVAFVVFCLYIYFFYVLSVSVPLFLLHPSHCLPLFRRNLEILDEKQKRKREC